MKRLMTLLCTHTRRTIAGLAITAMAFAALPGLASAQSAQNASQFNVPYGKSYNDFNRPFDARTRSPNGNRTIINGRMLLGSQSSLSLGLGGGFFGGGSFSGNGTGVGGFGSFGSAGAIGNQLNVVTVGNWNTVIIDSTQINNGDQTVNLNASSQAFHAPDVAADGPYTVATGQSPAKQLNIDTAPASNDELNGDIKLND